MLVALFSKDGPLPFSGQDAVNGGPAGFGGTSANFIVNGVAAVPYLKRIMPHGFGDIGFIKIDTEGYDSHLLRLLQPLLDDPTLATKRPTIRIEWFGQFRRGPGDQCTDGSRQVSLWPCDLPWPCMTLRFAPDLTRQTLTLSQL